MKHRFSWKYRAAALAVSVFLLLSCLPALAGGSLSGGGSGGSGTARRSVTRGFSWILNPAAAKAAKGSMESFETAEGRAAYVAGALADLYGKQLFDAEKLSLDRGQMAWDTEGDALTVEILLWYDGEPYIIMTGHNDKGQCCIVMGYQMDVSGIEDDTLRFWKKNTVEAYCDLLLSCYSHRVSLDRADIEKQLIASDQKMAAAMHIIPDPDAVRTVAVNGVLVNETPYEANGVVLSDIDVDGEKVICAFQNVSETDLTGLKWNFARYDAEGVLISSGTFALPDLPVGQSGIGSVDITADTAGILFVGSAAAAEIIQPMADASAAAPAAEAPVTEPVEPAPEAPVAETEVPAPEVPLTEPEVSAAESSEAEQEAPAPETEVPEIKSEVSAEEASEEPAERPKEANGAETMVIGGVTVNSLPLVLKGVALTGIEIVGNRVTCAFANDGGADAAGLSWHFACYDANGKKLREGAFAVPDMKAGQTAFARMYITGDTAYLFFMDLDLAPATVRPDTPAEDLQTRTEPAAAEPQTSSEPAAVEPETRPETPVNDPSRLRETKERDPKQI